MRDKIIEYCLVCCYYDNCAVEMCKVYEFYVKRFANLTPQKAREVAVAICKECDGEKCQDYSCPLKEKS